MSSEILMEIRSVVFTWTVTEELVLHRLLEDRGCITESIRILVPVDRMKQICCWETDRNKQTERQTNVYQNITLLAELTNQLKSVCDDTRLFNNPWSWFLQFRFQFFGPRVTSEQIFIEIHSHFVVIFVHIQINWKISYPMLSTFAWWSFSVTGPTMWKSLPPYLHDPDDGRDIFRQQLMTFFCIVRLQAANQTFYDNVLYKFTSTLTLTSGLKIRQKLQSIIYSTC